MDFFGGYFLYRFKQAAGQSLVAFMEKVDATIDSLKNMYGPGFIGSAEIKRKGNALECTIPYQLTENGPLTCLSQTSWAEPRLGFGFIAGESGNFIGFDRAANIGSLTTPDFDPPIDRFIIENTLGEDKLRVVILAPESWFPPGEYLYGEIQNEDGDAVPVNLIVVELGGTRELRQYNEDLQMILTPGRTYCVSIGIEE